MRAMRLQRLWCNYVTNMDTLTSCQEHGQSMVYTHVVRKFRVLVMIRPSLLARQRAGQPIKALVQTISSCGTRRLYEPLSIPKVVQSQLLGDLCSWHSIRKILLIRKYKNHSVAHFVFVDHFCQLFTGILNAVAVIAVNHVDQPVCALIVVAPEWANLVLAAHIPPCETEILVFHGLNVETDSRDCCDNLSKLQFIQNC